jgi:hypothetical protein
MKTPCKIGWWYYILLAMTIFISLNFLGLLKTLFLLTFIFSYSFGTFLFVGGLSAKSWRHILSGAFLLILSVGLIVYDIN